MHGRFLGRIKSRRFLSFIIMYDMLSILFSFSGLSGVFMNKVHFKYPVSSQAKL